MIHSSDSAGGLMTREFFSLNQNLLVSEAIKKIQSHQSEVLFYIYIVNSNNNLVGVLSLKQLLLCSPQSQLKNIMSADVISAHVTTTQSKVVEIVERYDFLALPVVNNHNQLEGIITVDDVIDVIQEEAKEQFLYMGQGSTKEGFWPNLINRIQSLSYSFVAGLICFFLLYMFFFQEEEVHKLIPAEIKLHFSLFPMALIMGLSVANQVSATTIAGLRNLEPKRLQWIKFLLS